MIKGPGIKFNKRKWNVTSEMESKDMSSNQVHTSDLTSDVHFVINSDFNLSTVPDNTNQIELSRKTYSKKPAILIHPFMSQDPLEPFRDSLQAKERLSSALTLKCSPATESKSPAKRARQDASSDSKTLLPKRMHKKNLAQSCNAKVPRLPRGRSSLNCNDGGSSDSDIEIVGVFKTTTPIGSKLHLPKKLTNGHAHTSKRSSKVLETKVNGTEVVINEGDVAPFVPADPTAEATSRAVKCLLANGEISVHPVNRVATKSEEAGKQGSSTKRKTHEDHKKVRGGRELKILYDHLNEISWARKNSFKKLLQNSDIADSKGGIGRSNLRKPIKKLQNGRVEKAKATHLVARKKSMMARLNHKSRQIAKNKTTMALKQKRLAKQAAGKGKLIAKPKSTSVVKSKGATKEETDILYSLPKPLASDAKPKTVQKLKSDTLKKKNALKVKTEAAQRIKSVAKTKYDIFKLKPDALKQKPNVLKLKPDGQKVKTNLLKLKPDKLEQSYFAQMNSEDSPPSTSGVRKLTFSGKSICNSKSSSKTSNVKNFLKSVEFSQEMQFLQGYLDENNDRMCSTIRKGSELRVRLQPLEQTSLWTSDFYDDVKRYFLDQAYQKAADNRDRDSISAMYQELLESYLNMEDVVANGNNTNGRAGSSNNRKKRAEEESSVRSSVRQSEGAFRNKEIVVKKHQRYIQVVLVPNEAKQNSLSVEAMKEMKEAFLLAKKDPNCSAVLLNSSGKYFCTGLDLSVLVGSNKKQAAEELASAVRELVLTLGTFTKPLVAAVNGVAVGFGVSLLTYCDVVLASDKATFSLPATRIGYVPEGGVTLTLPQVVGSNVASEMFVRGKRLTAEQALRYGLVSEVLWPTKLMNEVMPRLQDIISQPLAALETTKAMVRYHLWDKLKSHMDREKRLIVEQWTSAPCQNNIRQLMQQGGWEH